MSDNGKLVEAVERLERSLTAEIAAERRVVQATRLIVAAFLIVVGGFVIVNYVHFKGEWTEQKIAKSVEAQWEAVRPAVTREIRTLSRNVLPVYSAEFRKQLPAMAPEVGRVLHKQTQRFADDMRADTGGRIDATMQRAAQYTADEMHSCYPGLGSKGKEQLMQRHRELLTEAVGRTHAPSQPISSARGPIPLTGRSASWANRLVT